MSSKELDLFKHGFLALLLALVLVVCATFFFSFFLWSDAVHLGAGLVTVIIGYQTRGH